MVRSAFPGPNREDSVHGPGISRAGPDRSVRRASATPVIGRRAPRPNRNGAGGREGGAGPPRLRRNRPSRCADQRESGSPIGPLLGSLRRRTFPEDLSRGYWWENNHEEIRKIFHMWEFNFYIDPDFRRSGDDFRQDFLRRRLLAHARGARSAHSRLEPSTKAPLNGTAGSRSGGRSRDFHRRFRERWTSCRSAPPAMRRGKPLSPGRARPPKQLRGRSPGIESSR